MSVNSSLRNPPVLGTHLLEVHHGTHGKVCSKLMPSAGYEGLEARESPISEQDNGTKLLQRVNWTV